MLDRGHFITGVIVNQMFTLDEAVSAVRGQLIKGSSCEAEYPKFFTGVSKDTRTINQGEL